MRDLNPRHPLYKSGVLDQTELIRLVGELSVGIPRAFYIGLYLASSKTAPPHIGIRSTKPTYKPL